MLLKLLNLNRLIAKRTLRYVLKAVGVVELELGFLHLFSTIQQIKISGLCSPVVTVLLRVLTSHGYECFLLSFLLEASLSLTEIADSSSHVFVL